MKSFNTLFIDFEKLPWSRYYVSDFTELAQRYSNLLNPFVHLQQSLQAHLPGSDFWDRYDFTGTFCRKITPEFFTMQQARVFLRGDPPFRETCDMLAPDALGANPVNQDQWRYRTHGLQQASVWGQCPPPELLQRLRDEAAKAEQDAAEADAAQKSFNRSSLRFGGGLSSTGPKPIGASSNALAVPDVPGVINAWASDVGSDVPSQPIIDDFALSVAAATRESKYESAEILPPNWMKGCTIAPAPYEPGDDPPLSRIVGRQRFGATFDSFGGSTDVSSIAPDMAGTTQSDFGGTSRSNAKARVSFSQDINESAMASTAPLPNNKSRSRVSFNDSK